MDCVSLHVPSAQVRKVTIDHMRRQWINNTNLLACSPLTKSKHEKLWISKRSLLFWAVTQCRVVIFIPTFRDWCIVPKFTALRCVISRRECRPHLHRDSRLRLGLGCFIGLFQHCSRSAYCILTLNKFLHSSPEAPRIIQMRETSTSEGGNYYQWILLADP